MQPFGRRFVNPKRPAREGKLVAVGRVEDLPEGRCATVELLNGKELALYNVGGQFHAVENFCPHKGAPLADGDLSGHTIECAWHGWRFAEQNSSQAIPAADFIWQSLAGRDSGLSVFWIYLSVPAGCVLLAAHMLARMYTIIRAAP